MLKQTPIFYRKVVFVLNKLEVINLDKLSTSEISIFKELLEYLESNYLYDMNLEKLKGIKIVFDNEIFIDSDGKFEDNQVLLPISKTKRALSNNQGDDFENLKSTIYHELAHLDFRNNFPVLHNMYDEYVLKEDYKKAVPIQIWVEFNVERKNNVICNENAVKKYMESVINFKWDSTKETHFIILKKHLPYIIARINGKYLNKADTISIIKSDYVKRIILDVEKILYDLSKQQYRDSFDFLKELYDYLDIEESKY